MRKYYIDNIRWVTVLLVVVYHVIYIFNSILSFGIIGPVTTFHGQDAVQYLLYPWFMVILFIISGMCSYYYLENHSSKEYIKARTNKLLVPSTIGLFVFQWIQGYVNMSISNAFQSMPDTMPKPVLYIIMCFSGTGVLWTIQLMWFFSCLLILVRKIEKGRLWKAAGKATFPVIILMGILLWGFAQILNTPAVTVYRFGIYGFAFFMGYFLFSHDNITDILKKYSIPLACVAVISGIAYVIMYFGTNYAEAPVVNCPLAMAYCWFACLAIMGIFKRFFNKCNSFTGFMTRKSFGLYVFHYLTLSATAYVLVKYTTLPGIIIYLVTLIASLIPALLIYEIISRIPFIRWCVLGIRKKSF